MLLVVGFLIGIFIMIRALNTNSNRGSWAWVLIPMGLFVGMAVVAWINSRRWQNSLGE
jgi:hypothetical protein